VNKIIINSEEGEEGKEMCDKRESRAFLKGLIL
jgi:hypothetical protein